MTKTAARTMRFAVAEEESNYCGGTTQHHEARGWVIIPTFLLLVGGGHAPTAPQAPTPLICALGQWHLEFKIWAGKWNPSPQFQDPIVNFTIITYCKYCLVGSHNQINLRYFLNDINLHRQVLVANTTSIHTTR